MYFSVVVRVLTLMSGCWYCLIIFLFICCCWGCLFYVQKSCHAVYKLNIRVFGCIVLKCLVNFWALFDNIYQVVVFMLNVEKYSSYEQIYVSQLKSSLLLKYTRRWTVTTMSNSSNLCVPPVFFVVVYCIVTSIRFELVHCNEWYDVILLLDMALQRLANFVALSGIDYCKPHITVFSVVPAT